MNRLPLSGPATQPVRRSVRRRAAREWRRAARRARAQGIVLAPAFVAAFNSTLGESVTSRTFDCTSVLITDAIVVSVRHSTSTQPTSVTAGGVEMTKINGTAIQAGSTSWMTAYLLPAPAAGTVAVVITMAGSTSHLQGFAAVYSTVLASSPYIDATKNTGRASSASPSISLNGTGTVGTTVVGLLIYSGNASTYTPTNGTVRASVTAADGARWRCIDQPGAASAVQTNGSLNVSDNWCFITFELKPASSRRAGVSGGVVIGHPLTV